MFRFAKHVTLLLFFVPIALMMTRCTQTEPKSALSKPLKERDDLVSNTSKTYQIKTIATIGVDEAQTKEEEPYQFAIVNSIDCDHEGNIYALDAKSVCVKVFDQNGKFLRKMFSRGEGPKELSHCISIKINRGTQRLFILNANGYRIKVFDLEGNFIRTIKLPEQFMSSYEFSSKDKFVFTAMQKYGSDSYYNFKELNTITGKITGHFIKYKEAERDEAFNNLQRFAIQGDLLWTSPIHEMKIAAYNRKTRRVEKEYAIPGKLKKNKVVVAPYKGNGLRAVLGYNVVQPLLLDSGLFFLLTIKDYDLNTEPKWKGLVFPKSSKLSLMTIEKDKVKTIAPLAHCDHMFLEATYKNRIVLVAQDPYNFIKILEVTRGKN